jgi:CheY-specific phosphatase CheX
VHDAPDWDQWACIELSGTEGLLLCIGGDWDLASQLAAAASGFEITDFPDELVLDGLGEFLNVVVGSALVRLEADGLRLNFDPPSYVAPSLPDELSGAIQVDAYVFDMACGIGSGVLLLAVS